MANVNGTNGDDFIHIAGDGRNPPAGANNIPDATSGADDINAGRGDDTIFGGAGADIARFNISTDGADQINLGGGADVVEVTADAPTQVRLTFTSAEVGNDVARDSNTMANQDGGLAVRMQAEDGSGALTGPITRTDDEGITFVAGAGVTFDIRDLVSGAARGDQFEVVTLGTNASEQLLAVDAARPYYINGGMGDDTIFGGLANDFLVGGAGNDSLVGQFGNDSFIGGGGNDTITGGNGDNVVTHNITTDGADQVDLGGGQDVVNVNASAPTQVRLTFTSSEVGNGNGNDSNTMPNQDGGLAVRMQAEDGSGALTGPITRTDDEGITFVAGAGVTFDVRDLVTGAARGDQFEVVTLGTVIDNEIRAVMENRAYYINAGMGNDTVIGGLAADFLVGGAGNDRLDGTAGGNDSFIGGGGDDTIIGSSANNVATHNITTDGADQVNLRGGNDAVVVNANAPTQVRLTFTSSEVGNQVATDSNTMANQDGGLAVRMQAEDGSGALTGPVTRTDDEGITFLAGAGVTFDVRDLVTGAARGDQFEVVTLGTRASERLIAAFEERPYYINAGMGNDTVIGGLANDFLVGGAGNDSLDGTAGGNDSFIGGAGDDTIVGSAAVNVATHNITTDGADQVNLRGGMDTVNVNASAPTQVRLTFTSSEVGNGSANDSNTMANQDGGLAVRMQAEDGSGALTGPITRVDDEGVTFVAGVGVTFDVRDLVSGVARGDQFEVVMLGTEEANTLTALQVDRPYYINAGQGDDTITGGNGNDFLVGGAGADSMIGGDGDDSYIVDNVGDQVVELADGGTDLVLSSIDYTLGITLENLTLSGTGNVNGTGNRFDNVITGNAGANVIDGRVGMDILTGGLGADTFSFSTKLAPTNVDTITDFSVADDTIFLSTVAFGGLDTGPLDADAFGTGRRAADADERVIYNRQTGELMFDRDGSGTEFQAIVFAQLDPGLRLTADDFLVG